MTTTRIVLAYSPALDGTDAIRWLASAHDAEIVVLLLDYGQGRELEALRDQALAGGAVRAHVLDVGDAFAMRFVLPALQAGALFDGRRPMAPGLERALLASKLVEIAGIEQTTLIADGRSRLDPRIAVAAQTLDAKVRVVSLPPTVADGDGEQPSTHAVSELAPRQARGERVEGPMGERPAEAAYVELTFLQGAPTAINGIPMPLGDLLTSVNMLVGARSVGRFEPIAIPAATVLHAAHESLRDDATVKDEWRAIAQGYVDIIDRGQWFTPARRELDAKIDRLRNAVGGTVRLKLHNGECDIVEKKPIETKFLKVAAKGGN